MLAIIGFVLVSLIYFYPVLQRKQIFQSDIAQYTGMAKEQIDFREATEYGELTVGNFKAAEYALNVIYSNNYKRLKYGINVKPILSVFEINS